MRIVVAAVGRTRDPSYRALIDEYQARIRRYAALDESELRDERDDKVIVAIDKLLAATGPRAEFVALDVEGKALTSDAFARRLGASLDDGRVPVFAIGGAEGLPPAVRTRAHWKLSLGPMTLPHRLARLVLAEQIYRAFTILRGEPYAREGNRS